MQTKANKQILVRPHYEIVKVVDGDGLIVKNSKMMKENYIYQVNF